MADQSHDNGVKKPNPIDVHVGGRLRLRRMMLGISQEKLGDKLGLTFQQIQKYEKGTNRIGASRLYRLSKVLDVNVEFFFEEMPNEENDSQDADASNGERENHVLEFLNSRDGLELNKAFIRIDDAKIRRRLTDLVRAIAKDDA